ncbi:MAG: Spy/CpxP family protein refolding chaperone [Chrysiogenia bacterium]
MNKKIYFLLIMFLLLGSLAQAQAGKKLPPNMLNSMRFGLYMAENNLFEARFILRLKTEIGLTSQQEQKIENMMLAYEESAIRRGSDIKVLELKFASLLKGNRIDRREMEKQAREIGKMKTDLQVGHLNYLLDVRDTLSPEQIRKLEKMKEKFRREMRDKMGKRGGRSLPPLTEKEDLE